MDDRDLMVDAVEREDFRTLRPIRDDRRQLNRPHLLSPRRTSDTTLAPLHMLRNSRRDSNHDHPHHVSPPSTFRPLDLPRRTSDSPSHRPSTHLPSYTPGDYSPRTRTIGLHSQPPRHWLNDEDTNAARMDVDEADKSVRPRRQTMPNQYPTLMGSPSTHESAGSGVGTKRKMSVEEVLFPRSGDGPSTSSRSDHPSSFISEPSSLPSLKRRGSIATQNMAHLSIRDRHDSLESPPPEGHNSSQWWRHTRSDSNASTNTFSGPPPPFSEPSRGGQGASTAPFAWPLRPLPPGHSHMSGDSDGQVVSHRSSYYTSSPPGPPPPMPPPYGHDRRMSAPSGTVLQSPGSADRRLRSRSRPPSRSSDQELPSLSGEGGLYSEHGQTGDADDSGGSNGPHSKSLTPYSRSPELRVSHKLAERKRRKEMKDLFDELRDHLPADRAMKSSKWEILSKAVDYIAQMKRTQQDMTREIEGLRQELETARKYAPGGTPASPSHFPTYVPSASSPIRPSHTTRSPTLVSSPTAVSPTRSPAIARPCNEPSAHSSVLHTGRAVTPLS